MEIGRLDFVWPQLSLSRQSRGFAIVYDPPRINWAHEKGLLVLSGVNCRFLLSRISITRGPATNRN